MRIRVRGSQETRPRLTAVLALLALPLACFGQPELIVESMHSSRVTRNAFSPDSQFLITGGKDGRVRVFTSNGLRRVHELTASSSPILALQVHGNLVAAASEDARIRLWNYRDGTLLHTLGGHSRNVTGVAFSPDGKVLASASTDGSLRVWDANSGASLRTLKPGLKDAITALANERATEYQAVVFHPDGKTLIAGGTDRRVTFWDWDASRLARAIPGFASAITALRVSPDGEWLLTGTQQGAVKLHRLDSLLASFDVLTQKLPVKSFAFSPDARFLAIGMASSSVERRSAAGEELRQYQGLSGDVHDVSFSPDGKLFATGGDGNTPVLWEVPARQASLVLMNRRLVDFRLVEPEDEWLLPVTQLGDAVAFVEPAWQRLKDYRRITDRRGSPAVLPWRAVADNVEAWPATPASVAIRRGAATAAPLSIETPAPSTTGFLAPDGKLLVIGDTSGSLRLIDTATAKQVATWQPFQTPVSTVTFSADGKRIAASASKRIAIWDTATQKQVAAMDVFNPATHLTFSPEGDLLLSEARDGKRVWALPDGKQLVSFSFLNEGRDWVAASPKGLFDASAGGMRNTSWRFPEDKLGSSPLELFFNEFFFPGLLKRVLAGEALPQSLDLGTVDRRQPVIRLSLREEPGAAEQVSLQLSIEEAAPVPGRKGSGARDLRLFRNGVLVKSWPGNVLPANSAKSEHSAKVPLLSNENVFTAYAFNSANIKSPDATLRVKAPPQLRRKPVLHVLAIGVSRYANAQFNLNFSVMDVDSVATQMQKLTGEAREFSSLQLVKLADRDATKANILAALGALAGKPATGVAALARVRPVEPQDALLIYFAGHGTAHQNHFYLIPHDLGFAGSRDKMDGSALKTVLQHSVSDLELEERLLDLDVSRLGLVIDACHSGQVLEAEESRRGPLNTKGLAQLAYEKGMYVLAASQSFQAAMETKALGHGYLTYSLLEALDSETADNRPQDGALSMQEWLEHGVARVPDLHRGALGGQRNLIVLRETSGQSDVQTPRVYYRREADDAKWILRLWQ